jgi:hypothetical protein
MNKQINKERRDTMETNRNTQKQNNTKAEHVREKESDRERRSTACEGEGSQRRRAVVRVVVSRLEDGGGLDQCFHLQSTPSFFLNLLCLFFVLCDGAVIDSGGLLWKAVR